MVSSLRAFMVNVVALLLSMSFLYSCPVLDVVEIQEDVEARAIVKLESFCSVSYSKLGMLDGVSSLHEFYVFELMLVLQWNSHFHTT